MRVEHTLLITLALLGATACGPPGLAIDPAPDDGATSDGGGEATEAPDPPSTETETETETPDPTLTFVPETDEPSDDHCDPFAQNCPDGEKCVPYGSTGGNWDASKCVPIMGDQAPGDPCFYGGVVEATDDCDETGICWDVFEVDGEQVGVCTLFCTGTADDPECPPLSYCIDDLINLCMQTCDPLIQDCNPGQACFWANNNFNCIFTTDDIPVGEPCGYINDCAAGLVCLTTEVLPGCEGSSCCGSFCHLDLGDGQCDALPGTSCMPFFEQDMAPPGYEHIGVCILP